MARQFGLSLGQNSFGSSLEFVIFGSRFGFATLIRALALPWICKKADVFWDCECSAAQPVAAHSAARLFGAI
jgi:hypothetical protein